jgi:hypothetical protein
MMIRRMLFAGLAAASLACTPTSRDEGLGGSNNTATTVAIDDFPAGITSAYCATLVRCGVFGDLSFCTSALGTQVTGDKGFNSLGAVVAAVKANKITYDATAAKTCLTTLSQASCNNTQFSGFSDIPGCGTVFTGSLAAGDTCVADQECVAGSFCQDPGSSSSGSDGGTSECAGTCVAGGTQCHDSSQCSGGKVCSNAQCVTPVPAGGSGQPCGTGSSCQDGFYCDDSGESPVCAARGTQGQSCPYSGFANACATGFICVVKDDQSGSVCLAPKAKGDTCEQASQCGGPFSFLVCDPSSHKCVTRPTTGACVGTTVFGCDIRTTYCDKSGTPTCKPYKAAGDTCDPAQSECGLGIFGSSGYCSSNGSSGICTASTPSMSCTP